jgi:hypothetical protein
MAARRRADSWQEIVAPKVFWWKSWHEQAVKLASTLLFFSSELWLSDPSGVCSWNWIQIVSSSKRVGCTRDSGTLIAGFFLGIVPFPNWTLSHLNHNKCVIGAVKAVPLVFSHSFQRNDEDDNIIPGSILSSALALASPNDNKNRSS